MLLEVDELQRMGGHQVRRRYESQLATGLRTWVADAQSRRDGPDARLFSELGALLAEVRVRTGLMPRAASTHPAPGLPLGQPQLTETVRILADLVAYYEGAENSWRQRRHPRKWSIARALAELARVDLIDQRSIARQTECAPHAWSPAASPEHEAFREIATQTQCSFAPSAVAWSTERELDPDKPGDIDFLSRRLTGFTRAVQRETLGCFVATFAPTHGETVEMLSTTTNRVLRGLARRDGIGAPFGNPTSPHWRFMFRGEIYFVLAIGPCYPRTHARYGFEVHRTVLIFQPDTAFVRAAGKQGLITPTVRRRIRAKYELAGRPYDVALTESPVESHRFVKPLELGEEAVRWWET